MYVRQPKIGLGLGLGASGNPSLALSFVDTLDPRISFTRASAATYVNSAGNVVTTPASKNLLTFTEEFANAAWTKTSATITADTLTASAGSGAHAIHQVTSGSGVTLTMSIYAKAGASSFLQLVHTASSNTYANFNLTAGTVGTVGSLTTASITPAGDGWYRCSITFTPSSGSFMRVSLVSSATAASNESWTTAGTETVYLWGAQLETGSTATSYVRNYGGLFPPRFDYDPVTLQPRGLLIEEQRTNLLLNSTIDGANLATQSVSVSAVAHTLSFYGTGSVVLSGAHSATVSGSGAYPARTTLTFTPSAGTLTLTVSGTVQFAQLEADSFATSYIPTAGSQVTRTADQASIVAPNFAPWYNQSEGTFVVEADSTINPTVLSVFRAAAVSDGTTGNAVILFTYNAKWGGSVTVGGVNQCDLQQSGSYTANVPAKVAMAYKADDFAVSVNGLTALTDASGSIPAVDRLSIGSINSSTPLNGHIRRIAYYPSRLSNAQLQALSA